VWTKLGLTRKKKIKNMIKNNSLVIIDAPKIGASIVAAPIVGPELKVYSNADTEKLQILTDNFGKAPAEESQALREGPGCPFPELEFTNGNITNHWAHKMYVGSAVDLSKRLKNYFNINYLNRHKYTYIYNAIISHGYSAFSLTILKHIDISHLDKKQARKLILSREQYYIDSLNPEYNILKIAGSSLGFNHSEETLAKMSEAKSGENNPMFGRTGENNPRGMQGKTHSEESLLKMSKAQSGENNPMSGKIHKEETIARMSVAKGGSIIYVYSFLGSPESPEKSTLINTFSSARKAAKHFNYDNSTISSYIKSGKLFKGEYILSINPK
jgi:group I intron endonuclease